MVMQETYVLANGVEIPKLGLGTWFIDDDKAADAVCEAVKLGYRHIDTAQAYGNERGVGEGIRSCGLKREEIFVTTKLAAEAKTYEEAAAAIDGSLEKMDIGYIDLMLIHAPQPWLIFAAAVTHRETERPGKRWRKRIRQASCAPLACRISRKRIWKTSCPPVRLLLWSISF